MGPVSSKLVELRDAPTEEILQLICGSELDELRGKYMRLKIDHKEKFMNILGNQDAYDVLESNNTALDFADTLTNE